MALGKEGCIGSILRLRSKEGPPSEPGILDAGIENLPRWVGWRFSLASCIHSVFVEPGQMRQILAV